MSLLAAIAIVTGGVLVFGALLVRALVKSSHDAGKIEEQNEEQRKADAAKDRANEVLAERRDPSDANRRLRDGSF